MTRYAFSLLFAGLGVFMCMSVPGPVFGQKPLTLGDAIRQTLEMNRDVRIEYERVAQSQARFRSASGRFDWRLTGAVVRESFRGPNPDGDDIQLTTQEFYSVGIAKRLRNGMVFEPNITLQQADNIVSTGPVGISSVNMTFVVPLLRNLGAQNTAAQERAAYTDLQSARTLKTHQVAGRVLQTATAFYECLAAYEQLQILRDAEQLTLTSMNMVDRMITAALLDPADRLQAQAVVASKQAARRAGEQALYRRRLNLAEAIGYRFDEMTEAPLAEGAFPEPISRSELDAVARTDYIQRAMRHRGDYLASLKNMEMADILLQQADNARKMRLDFNVRVGYTGFDLSDDPSRRVRALYTNPQGPNVVVGLSMDLPLRNDAALGDLAFRQAEMREARHRSERVATAIGADVLAALEDLRSAVDQYRLVVNAEQVFEAALDHEQKKMTTGQASLTDLLQIQDRYIEVRLARVRALREYAVAMARFRFVTGTLLEQDEDEARFDLQRLRTLPFTEMKDEG